MSHPTTDTDEIAIGTPVFSRTDALVQLLESIPGYVSTVYIADNGHTNEREHVYTDRWPFAIKPINVEYDAGIGACRWAIADRVTEPYLFVCDNDMEITRERDLERLEEILDANPDLGAVSGWLQEGNTIRAGARDLIESGDKLFKTIDGQPEIETNPYPFARFDFIPQCGLFRTDVYETYTYDLDIYNSEHIDFMYGHKVADEWDFASTPIVLIQHHRDIDPDYRESTRGNNHVDWDMMQRKWGKTQCVPGARPDWMFTRDRNVKEHAFDVFRRVTPPRVWLPVRRFATKVLP